MSINNYFLRQSDNKPEEPSQQASEEANVGASALEPALREAVANISEVMDEKLQSQLLQTQREELTVVINEVETRMLLLEDTVFLMTHTEPVRRHMKNISYFQAHLDPK